MTVKVLEGQCGYKPGPHSYIAEVELSKADAEHLRSEFTKLGVWNLPAEWPLPNEICILDGTEWCMEMKRGADYHRVVRTPLGLVNSEDAKYLREVVKFDVDGYEKDWRRCEVLGDTLVRASGKELGEWWGSAGIERMGVIQQLGVGKENSRPIP